MTTPSPSLPISLSPPSAGERLARCTTPPAHSSPPPVPLPLLPSSGCPTQIQTLRIAYTQALIEAVTAALPSPPLPQLPPSLYILPPVDCRDDILESEPTRGRGIDYGFVHARRSEERRQGIRDVGYGIRDTWVDPAEAVPEIVPMTVREVNTRVTELAKLHKHDTHDLMVTTRRQYDGEKEEAYASREGSKGELDQTRTRARNSRSPDSHGDADITSSDLIQIMAPTTRRGPNTPVNNTNPNNMTLESIQAMIDQALLRNSTNGDGSHSSHEDNRRNVQTARPCFYADFMKCQPLNFKGTEGVVGLTRWIEKMESVFISSGQGERCSTAYTERFQELTLICTKFVANETEKVDKYISGLPDNIYGNVKSARPKMLDETIELANDLMDQKLRTYAERQSDNKKKKAMIPIRNNHGHSAT
ncbi:hypothetical protein Tco_0727014 [Tanacetum coccineum]|uniref:Reverse transcriptase domain-containing protein n=1 Tax=Tanacetum coccineum TaxID=301880 RepID=A0ABQ4YK66_9ASTR